MQGKRNAATGVRTDAHENEVREATTILLPATAHKIPRSQHLPDPFLSYPSPTPTHMPDCCSQQASQSFMLFIDSQAQGGDNDLVKAELATSQKLAKSLPKRAAVQ
jgi:hypothetical protein